MNIKKKFNFNWFLYKNFIRVIPKKRVNLLNL